jgi:hypothetical protein
MTHRSMCIQSGWRRRGAGLPEAAATVVSVARSSPLRPISRMDMLVEYTQGGKEEYQRGWDYPPAMAPRMLPRTTWSAPFFAFDLRNSRLHQFLNKGNRYWLVRREMDSPFGCGKALEIFPKRVNNRGRGEQTAVVRKRGEPHQHPLVLERGDPIADGLGSLRRHSGPNRRAHFDQGAVGGFRDTGKIFVNASRSAVAFWRRPAIARFYFFLHAGDTTRTFPSGSCSRPSRSHSK